MSGACGSLLSKQKHKSEVQILLTMTLRWHCAVHRATAILLPNVLALHPAAHCAAGIAHPCSDGAESIILSAGSAKSMMLSAHAESIILSAPPAESMMLSAWGHARALMLREYHTLSGRRWEYDALSACWEYHNLAMSLLLNLEAAWQRRNVLFSDEKKYCLKVVKRGLLRMPNWIFMRR